MKVLFGFIVIAASFASLTTELLQTHILTIIWGGLITQLTLVFATYIFSLGMGALVYKKSKHPEASFIKIQILLGTCSLSTPFILLYTNYFLSSPVAHVISYALIFLVGFFSGFEIPLLNDIFEKNRVYAFSFENIMTLDYLGMAVACFLFSIYLIRQLGFWGSLFFNVAISLTSILVIFALFRQSIPKRQFRMLVPTAALLLIVVAAGFAKTEEITRLTTAWITG